MRVLLLTQHFPPEVTAGSFRLEAFAGALARRGHEVTVLCPVPNHPSGIVQDGYRGRPILRRRVTGASTTYLRVFTSPRKSARYRIAYYGSYAALATLAGLFGRRPDVVVASSPPLTVGAAGLAVAGIRRAPLLIDIRDLWPQSAVDLGELGPGRMLDAAERLERLLYERADRVVTTNEAFKKSIAQRAPSHAEIEVVPNGTTATWLETGESEVARSDVNLPRERFVWAYAGNLGLAHGLDRAVDAAAELDDDFLLLIIGDGARREELAERASKLRTVELRGLMAPIDAARHLRSADVVLLSERQEATVSAKLYDLCAIGRPVVAACRGEIQRIVESESIGIAVPHGDSSALAEALRRLRNEPALGERLTERARAFARLHLREEQANRFADLVESLGVR